MNLLNRNNGSTQDETDPPVPSSVNINSVSETESDESAFDSALENDLTEDSEQIEKEADQLEQMLEFLLIEALNQQDETQLEKTQLKEKLVQVLRTLDLTEIMNESFGVKLQIENEEAADLKKYQTELEDFRRA